MEPLKIKYLTIDLPEIQDTYPVEFIADLAKNLNCKEDELACFVDIADMEEIWSIDDLNEVVEDLDWSVIGILKSEYDGMNLGSVELIRLNGIVMIAEQNASPMGLWMKAEDLILLETINIR